MDQLEQERQSPNPSFSSRDESLPSPRRSDGKLHPPQEVQDVLEKNVASIEEQGIEKVLDQNGLHVQENGNVVNDKGTFITTLEQINSGLQVGSSYLIEKINQGGEKFNTGIRSTGNYINTKVDPNEKPSKVNSVVSGSVNAVAYVTPYGKFC